MRVSVYYSIFRISRGDNPNAMEDYESTHVTDDVTSTDRSNNIDRRDRTKIALPIGNPVGSLH